MKKALPDPENAACSEELLTSVGMRADNPVHTGPTACLPGLVSGVQLSMNGPSGLLPSNDMSV
jgi:hypothetical protein